MLQVGSTARVKSNAFAGSPELQDFKIRGRVGTIVFEVKPNEWEVEIDGHWFILSSNELEEIDAGAHEEFEPDTPAIRDLAAKIKAGIETYGWDEFERLFTVATGLVLVKEENGKRFYPQDARQGRERPDGQMKITIGAWLPDEAEPGKEPTQDE